MIEKNKIGFGIKFFKKQEHKKMFDEGKLFSNSISYYRKNEKELGKGRGDSNEGILSVKPTQANQVNLHDLEGKLISTGMVSNISVPILEEQHIFSFIYLEENWYEVTSDEFRLKIPKVIFDYFFQNYGEYFSIFSIDKLISRLNNKILESGDLAYVTHFKVEYVDEQFLESEKRWVELNGLMDEIESLINNFEKGKPKLDVFMKGYMGMKSKKYRLENEMRIVLGVFSNYSSLIDLGH